VEVDDLRDSSRGVTPNNSNVKAGGAHMLKSPEIKSALPRRTLKRHVMRQLFQARIRLSRLSWVVTGAVLVSAGMTPDFWERLPLTDVTGRAQSSKHWTAADSLEFPVDSNGQAKFSPAKHM
jgi:hypothetical protein